MTVQQKVPKYPQFLFLRELNVSVLKTASSAIFLWSLGFLSFHGDTGYPSVVLISIEKSSMTVLW